MLNIVTVEREYGCGAGGIAKKLAERLSWKLWDEDITGEIARRLNCPKKSVQEREERLDPTYYRLIKAFMRGSYEDRTGNQLELLDAEGLSALFEKVINEIARQGNCVIVGRAAPYFLRERKDVFRVFIYAPEEEKIRRVIAMGKTEHEAAELVDRVDKERGAFIKKFYNKAWPQRSLYHLMINSEYGDDMVLDMITHAMELVNAKQNAMAGAPVSA